MINQQETEISTLGEFGLIERLTKDIELKNPSSVKGVGDDCAVLHYGEKETLVTTDLLLEGIHFDFDSATIEAILDYLDKEVL